MPERTLSLQPSFGNFLHLYHPSTFNISHFSIKMFAEDLLNGKIKTVIITFKQASITRR